MKNCQFDNQRCRVRTVKEGRGGNASLQKRGFETEGWVWTLGSLHA